MHVCVSLSPKLRRIQCLSRQTEVGIIFAQHSKSLFRHQLILPAALPVHKSYSASDKNSNRYRLKLLLRD